MNISGWLAIYAAVLSTIVFVWNIVQSRPKLKVMVVYGYENHVGGISISVQNRSSHTIHLAGISILYRYHRPSVRERLRHAWQFKRLPRRLGWVHSSLSNYRVASGCPLALQAHDSHHVLVPEAVLESIFKESVDRCVMAVAQDKLWNNAYSNVLEFSKPRASESPA